MSVDEPTECVGMCMHMGKCIAFNVNETVSGAYICEFLRDNRCGFVDKRPGNSIFCSHKQCSFQILEKTNWKCITITEAGFFREATGIDPCVSFQLNLDGSGFKLDNKCVGVKEERGRNKVDWLVKSSITDDNKCQVHLNGTDDHFQLKEISSKKCVTNYKFEVYTYLVLGECDTTFFKIHWNDYVATDTIDTLTSEHLL